MNWYETFSALGSRLAGLGTRRLSALCIAVVTIIAVAILAAVRLGQPAQQVLYSGLSKQETGKISVALRDANVPFDVSADSATIYVPFGNAPRARMLLAKKGLPNSTVTGYELFDKIGSLGLTSFMQEVTKLRAIEGELARTIQTIKGVLSARVHIVLPNPNTFRRNLDAPTASVVLRSRGLREEVPVAAIRHLVAAALPGLKVKNVTIVTSDGKLFAAPDSAVDSGQTQALLLEHQIAKQIRSNISKGLAPYLLPKNIRISVVARINADRKKAVERFFIPNSRVERSVRVVRESSDLKNAESNKPTTVQQNLPDVKKGEVSGSKTEATNKRSETTNYEISTRTTNIDFTGYQIKKLSIAVVINSSALPKSLQTASNKKRLTSHLAEIEKVIEAASGLVRKRGDLLKIATLKFREEKFAPTQATSFTTVLLANSTSFINGLFVILTTMIIVLMCFKPLLKYLLATEEADNEEVPIQLNSDIASSVEQLTFSNDDENVTGVSSEQSIQDIRVSIRDKIQSREDDAVLIMKQWMAQDAA